MTKLNSSYIHGIVISLFITASSLAAITNGTFNSGLDGGWIINDENGVVWSPSGFWDEANQGTAKLQYHEGLACSSISLSDFIDNNSTALRFQIRTPRPVISETDHLYIKLLDNLGNSVLGTNSFFHWKSGDAYLADPPVGWLQGETPAGVSVVEELLDSPDLENNPDWQYVLYSIQVDILDGWWAQQLTLNFSLYHQPNDGIDSTILIDNVQLFSSNTSTVPAPGAILLALAGLTSIRFLHKRL